METLGYLQSGADQGRQSANGSKHTELRFPSFRTALKNANATSEVCALAPNMTKLGLTIIMRDVEKIARKAIQQHHPRMQASDVDDVTQNALIKIMKKIDTFDGSRQAAPWISVVAIRTAADWYRAKNERPFFQAPSYTGTFDESEHKWQSRLPSREPNPDSRLLEQERRHEIRKIWEALGEADTQSTGYREVLLLHSLGYRSKRLAEVLGVEPNAAEVRTYRLKKMLRRITAQENPDMD